MIADPRADALMTAFTGQWLQLRNLDKVTPDVLLFPDFDDNVRQALRRETELLFASIVRENRSALALLDADYTFVNERLARHYGIRGVYGSRFRRVPVDGSEPARPAGPRQHPVDDRGRHAHVARAAREVHHLESAEHAAAAAAGGRAGSRGERAQGPAIDGPRAARTASRQSGVRLVPSQHRSRRLRAGELRRRRAVAPDHQGRARHRCGRRARRWIEGRWAGGAAEGPAGQAGRVRGDDHREDC